MESAQWLQWTVDSSKRLLFIDSHCNYFTARMADKWIPVHPDADAVLALAIAYVWIKEGTYSKECVATKLAR